MVHSPFSARVAGSSVIPAAASACLSYQSTSGFESFGAAKISPSCSAAPKRPGKKSSGCVWLASDSMSFVSGASTFASTNWPILSSPM